MPLEIVLHIPHSSLRLPRMFYKGCRLHKKQLRHYLVNNADLNVDRLFNIKRLVKIKPKYSRLFCDVERFVDDDKEIMAKYGQGVIYTHNYDGTLLHVHNEVYRNKVLKYYHDYHNSVDTLVDRIVASNQGYYF